MIKLWLIRHGKTEGNKLSRYIGTTDEPLCQEGTEFLHKMDYPKVQAVYVSPLKRCVQTAEILFPGEPVHIIEELAECDFGEFENKNYKELEGNPHYQEWIDSKEMAAAMRWSWMRISGRMDENSSGLILRLWKDNSPILQKLLTNLKICHKISFIRKQENQKKNEVVHCHQ